MRWDENQRIQPMAELHVYRKTSPVSAVSEAACACADRAAGLWRSPAWYSDIGAGREGDVAD